MSETEDAPIDEVIQSIRAAIVEKERKKYFDSFKVEPTECSAEGIFELSKTMLVKREDIPYQVGVWSFDDVAKKMLKKYHTYFKHFQNKEDKK